MGREMEPELRKMRPDVMGGIVAWHGGGEFTQVVYFESEAAARAGESNTSSEGPPQEWLDLLGHVSYIDLPDPVLI
jgi:hypothetical protein